MKVTETLYTPTQVAEIFRVKPATVWDWVRKGKMKAIKVSSRNYRITEKQLNDYVAKCRGVS